MGTKETDRDNFTEELQTVKAKEGLSGVRTAKQAFPPTPSDLDVNKQQNQSKGNKTAGRATTAKRKVRITETTHEKSYICDACGHRTARKTTLRRHIVVKHLPALRGGKRSGAKRPKSKWKVALSDRILIQVTPDVPQRILNRRFNCKKCEKSFKKNSNLKKHADSCSGGDLPKRKNSYQQKKSEQKEVIFCETCGLTFATRYTLKNHQPKCQAPSRKKLSAIASCLHEGCEMKFFHKSKLMQHLKTIHNVSMNEPEVLTFPNRDAFLYWKDEQEEKTFSYFTLGRGGNSRVALYYCQQDGKSRPHVRNGMVARKTSRRNSKGLVKADRTCLARIKVEWSESGEATVWYDPSHSHPLCAEDCRHHPLSTATYKIIDERLALGWSPKDIAESLKRTRFDGQEVDVSVNPTKNSFLNLEERIRARGKRIRKAANDTNISVSTLVNEKVKQLQQAGTVSTDEDSMCNDLLDFLSKPNPKTPPAPAISATAPSVPCLAPAATASSAPCLAPSATAPSAPCLAPSATASSAPDLAPYLAPPLAPAPTLLPPPAPALPPDENTGKKKLMTDLSALNAFCQPLLNENLSEPVLARAVSLFTELKNVLTGASSCSVPKKTPAPRVRGPRKTQKQTVPSIASFYKTPSKGILVTTSFPVYPGKVDFSKNANNTPWIDERQTTESVDIGTSTSPLPHITASFLQCPSTSNTYLCL